MNANAPQSGDDGERAQQPPRVCAPAPGVQLQPETLHHWPETRAERDAHAVYREERCGGCARRECVEDDVRHQRRPREY